MKACFTVLLAALVLILASCGHPVIGWGVMMWPQAPEAPEAASVVAIHAESLIRNTLMVSGGKRTEPIEVHNWQVLRFDNKAKAEEFAKAFKPFRDYYVRSNKHALPVRESADRLSNRVYKFRQGEEAKVIEIAEQESDENGLKGKWIKVLTMEGVTGWCFDYYLDVYDTAGNLLPKAANSSQPEGLAKLYSTDWRPSWFVDFVREDRLNLERFKPDFGLFFDQEENLIRLVLPGQAVEAPLNLLKQSSVNDYVVAEPRIRMTLRRDGTLRVLYNSRGLDEEFIFVPFKDDVDELIQGELDRRREVYNRFLKAATAFTSSAYGSLVLHADYSFTWEPVERLIPILLPAGTSGKGSVDMSYFLGPRIKSMYEGAIAFNFETATMPERVVFLFNFRENGVQLTSVLSQHVSSENVITQGAMNPVIISFTALNAAGQSQ